MMSFLDIEKKLKQIVLLVRACVWASMHSPDFQHCRLYISRPPMRVEVYWGNFGYKRLLIEIYFYCPRVSLDIPWHVYSAFLKATKEQGEVIDEQPIDNIPF